MSEDDFAKNKTRTIIPKSNDEFRYVETEVRDGRQETTIDETYRCVNSDPRLAQASRESPIAEAIRAAFPSMAGKYSNIVKVEDNLDKTDE